LRTETEIEEMVAMKIHYYLNT